MTKAICPSTAMAVANWFLEKSWSEPDVPPCDQLKLYKLVYFAQAWFLANFDKPLFEEDIEAWPHGPVVRDLYIEFKDFGRDPITKLGTRLESRGGEFEVVTPKHDGSLDGFLQVVWDNYKKYKGTRLSNATHARGEPWEIVSRHYDLDEKPTIPIELIQEVFKAKIANT
tara:strand:- start:9997 stop:10506 length:510 start_codon:yes stop_codon:yes gene_type:complete